MATKRCFVIMGYGRKPDPHTGKRINFDIIYSDIVKPAVEECGYQCFRGDEVLDSRMIDISMYYGILDSDLVIADISTLNPNAIYELGVRHGVKKRKTIIMMEKKDGFFFDLNHVRTVIYNHPKYWKMKDDEIQRVKSHLKGIISSVDETSDIDSPLYTYINELEEPHKKTESNTSEYSEAPLYKRVKDAISLIDKKDYVSALAKFSQLKEEYPNDSFFIQKCALCSYKINPDDKEGYKKALTFLEPLIGTLDPETNGLVGSIHKRLFEMNGDATDIEEAINSYGTSYNIYKDYYTGENYAYCLNLKATTITDEEEKSELNIIAKRVRKEIYNSFHDIVPEEINSDYEVWMLATLATCAFVLKKEDYAYFEELFLSKAKSFMRESYFEQKEKIIKLLNI